MSDNEDYNLEDIPYDDNEEVLVDAPPKHTTKTYKRKPTAKQLETMRKNLEKGRAKRQEQVKARKQQEQEYTQYVVDEGKQPRDGRYYDDEYSDYSDGYSDGEPEYEIRKRKPKQQPAEPKEKPPTKKEQKEMDRLDKMENILMNLLKQQKKARKRPQVVKNTIVQIPKSGGSVQATPAGVRLLKLFG
jgi:hypothetical protein